jgi:hypothetical protein
MGVVRRVDDPVDVVNRDDQGLGKTPGRKVERGVEEVEPMPSEKISKEGRRQGRVQRKRDVQFFDSGVLGVLWPAPSVANEQELQILIRL